jgi:phosphoribosylglycinamide formyltransferase-1
VLIGALASGTGTILQALIEAELPIAVALTDRACLAEKVAEAAGVPVVRVERVDFSPRFDRDAYTVSVVEALASYQVDLLAMAGFGTVLGSAIHEAYPMRVLNTHPALLPAFKGWHAVKDALDAGVKVTGCTVHLATLEVDEGPILAQEAVEVAVDDDEDRLAERIKQVERRLYPATLRVALERLGRGEELA